MTDFDILYDCHNSLAKLKTSHIQLYLLHRDDPQVPVGPIMETLNRLHAEGKIGVFGASNWTMERMMEANEYAYKHGLVPFTVSSPNFGLANQLDDPWGGGCRYHFRPAEPDGASLVQGQPYSHHGVFRPGPGLFLRRVPP